MNVVTQFAYQNTYSTAMVEATVIRCCCLKDEVIRLNAEAVRWIQEGSFRRATLASLAAMQHAKVIIAAEPENLAKDQQDQEDQAMQMEEDDDSERMPPLSSLDSSFSEDSEYYDEDELQEVVEEVGQCFSVVQVQCGPVISSEAASSREGMFPLFQSFLLLKDKQSVDDILARNIDALPCILLYNIGLSLHLESMHTGNEKLLTKAVCAYEHALALLTNMSEYDVAMDAGILLLLLSCLNNLASLEASQCFNLAQAVRYAKLIQQILENDDYADLLDDSIFDFFVLYLFLVPHMCHISAPAA